MSINLWHRVTTTVRGRYQRTALAQYGAGLHTDCDDCATAPADVAIPAPRGRASDAASPETSVAARTR